MNLSQSETSIMYMCSSNTVLILISRASHGPTCFILYKSLNGIKYDACLYCKLANGEQIDKAKNNNWYSDLNIIVHRLVVCNIHETKWWVQ